jgi:dephospho-CoA kinase
MYGIEKMSPIHIWMMCGYAGSGKTTAAHILRTHFDPKTTLVTAFADAVKDDVALTYQLPREMFDTQEGKATIVKTPDGECTARDLLIDYSLAMKEAHGEAVWAKEVVRRIYKEFEKRAIQHILIHDWRFVSEIETMKSEFVEPEFILHTVRIVRSSVCGMNIPSERNIDHYSSEFCIENNGSLDDLNCAITEILSQCKVK